MGRWGVFGCTFLSMLHPMAVGAQAVTRSGQTTIGLALSGGSAKGFAHVGVLRALEEIGVPIDVVTGTSMGSVVGALYSMGVSVDSLEALTVELDWPRLMGDRVERNIRSLDQRVFDERTIASIPLESGRAVLPIGAVPGASLMRVLEDLTWPAALVRDFSTLDRRFAAVATDLETGEAVLLRGGVLAEALRASTSLPGALEPIRIGDRLLADGGLARNLPADDARALGADFVICSDVSDPLRTAEEFASVVDVLTQAIAFRMIASTEEQRRRCDILIRPEIEGIPALAFDRALEWIDRGEAAVSTHQEALAVLAAPRPRARVRAPGRRQMIGDSVRLSGVRVEGAERPDAQRLATRLVGAEPNRGLTRRQLLAGMRELDATGLFGLSRYRLDATAADTMLTLILVERPRDRLGFGLRYDDERKAAILFTALVHNLVRYGSTVRLDVRLGEEPQVTGSYLRGRGVTAGFSLGGTAGWARAPLVFWEEGVRTSQIDVEVTSLTALTGLVRSRSTFFGVELRAERSKGVGSVAVADFDRATQLASVAARVAHEGLDDRDFPTRGVDATAKLEWGVTGGVTEGSFASALGSLRYVVPIRPAFAAEIALATGVVGGDGVPRHREFSLGGAHSSVVFAETQRPFKGLLRQRLRGRVLQTAGVQLRWEFANQRFLIGRITLGGVDDRWRLPVRERSTGWVLGAALGSPVGPVRMELNRATGGRGVGLSFSIGRAL